MFPSPSRFPATSSSWSLVRGMFTFSPRNIRHVRHGPVALSPVRPGITARSPSLPISKMTTIPAHHSPPTQLVPQVTGRGPIISVGVTNSRRVVIVSSVLPVFNKTYNKVPLLGRATTCTKYLETAMLGTAEQRQGIATATASWSLDVAIVSIFRPYLQRHFPASCISQSLCKQ